MRKLIGLFVLLCFAGLQICFAQTREITGTVVDKKDRTPLPGVSVVVKGNPSTGVATDINGKFTLKVNDEDVLVFSFIGMKPQEVAVKGKTTIQVEMESASETLDEVMVVAYGTEKRKAFTGSATVVGSEELSKRVTTNVANALVGTTPGLQLRGGSGAPGAGQGNINIRGIASLYAATDPLIIVDGAPYSASLSNIPQEDIESITVLKDAASAALYGARGAAGVILVTTKSGQNKKAQINVDIRLGANSRAVQDYETINDPGQYYETVYGQYYNDYYYKQGQDAATANINANNQMLKHLAYNVYTLPDGEQLIGMNGKLNPNATLGRSYEANGETYYLLPDNWRDAAYSTAFRQEYSISANGSYDRGSYYTSVSYLNEDGIIEYSGFKRFSARLKTDYQAKDWLKLGGNIGYINSKTTSNPNLGTSSSSSNLLYYTSHIAPIYPIYVRVLDENGNPKIRTDEHGNPQYDYGVPSNSFPGLSRPFLSTNNPLGANRYNDVTSKGGQLNATLTQDVKITNFLKFNATSTLNWGHTNYSDYETALYGPKVSVNGQIDKSQTDALRQNYVQTLTYFDQFGQHHLNFMLGHEYYNTKTTYLYAYGQGLFSPSIPEISGAANKVSSNSYTTEYNVEGYFGSLSYNYDEKYFLSASYRRDASSRFAKDNRWGNFWSIGGAWLVNREKFFHANWIDQLKLKLSLGQQGNDNIGNWAYTDLYSLSPASTTQMTAEFYRIGNPDITWETTTNLNIGIEFNLFGNRLNGNVDYYHKKTTDLLFWLSVPESAGSRGYYGNIGDIRNSGIELSLQGTVIRTPDIEWTLHFNMAHNSDKILKLPASKTTTIGGFTEDRKWFKEGGHLYNYFIPEYAGVSAQGEALYWVDAELNGKTDRPGKNHSHTTTNPNEATKYEQGNSLPDVFGGFGTMLSAYGIDLSVTFDYQIGGQIMDMRYQSLMSNITSASSAGNAIHKDALKSWSPNNTSSNIPRFQYGDQYTTAISDRWMTSASYLNFQSFSVGYTLPKRLLLKWGIDKLRVYATGENLCFWSARQGLDPRYAYGQNESLNVYSPVRTIMGGIQLTF